MQHGKLIATEIPAAMRPCSPLPPCWFLLPARRWIPNQAVEPHRGLRCNPTRGLRYKPIRGLRCRSSHSGRSRGHITSRGHVTSRSHVTLRGPVSLRRWIPNQTIKPHRGSRHLSLSLNRRNKYTKDKAQDCKTLHRSSPLQWVCVPQIDSDLLTASVLPIGSERRLRYVAVVFGGCYKQHLISG